MKNEVVYNEETKTYSGYVVVDVTTSLTDDLKKEAVENRKNGIDERPIGAEVPHKMKVVLNDVTLDSLIAAATKPVVIREQRKEKTEFNDAESFENGILNSERVVEFKAERTVMSSKERMKRFFTNLSPEQKIEFLEDPEKYLDEM